jgi:hypothetical protein
MPRPSQVIAVQRTVAAAVSTLLLPLAWASGATVPFPELEGTYLSSMLGGCTLTLRSRGPAVIRCGSDPPLSAPAVPHGTGFGVLVPATRTARQAIPYPQPRSRAPAWPPSLEDPTGPLVVSRPTSTVSLLWLQPVRWGPRLYLVREEYLAAFCGPGRGGREPRGFPYGDEFLRSGDDRKLVPRGALPECWPLE